MKITGLDLSLTGTGIAVLADQPIPNGYVAAYPRSCFPQGKHANMASGGALGHYLGVLVSPTPTGTFVRWQAVLDACLLAVDGAELIVIEGYSFGSFGAYSTAIRELGGIVRYHLAKEGKRMIEVAPTSLKKFVAGSGKAEKNTVLLEVYKRWGLSLLNDNVADAFGLAKIGEAVLASGSHADWPQFQREVIEAIVNPKPKAKKKGRSA